MAPEPLAIAACVAAARDEDAAALLVRAFHALDDDADLASTLARQVAVMVAVDSSQGGLALHAMGMAECLLGRIAEGCEMLRSATDTLHRHGPLLAECQAWRDYGSVLTHLSSDPVQGVEAMQRALALAEALGDSIEQGIVMSRVGPVLGRIGRFDEALATLRRAIELLAHAPDRSSYAGALDNLAYLHLQQDDYAQALPLLQAELPLRDPQHERLRHVNCQANLSVALAGLGQGPAALALLAAIGPRLDANVDQYQWADYRFTAGRVLLLLGQVAEARRHLLEGLQFAREHRLSQIELEMLGQLSRAEESAGDLGAALAIERKLRKAEREWLDEKAASHAHVLKAGISLTQERAEKRALEVARAELEQRVLQRTADLTEQMRERETAEELARFWADHDWLTRLPNRRQLQATLSTALSQARAEGTQLGVLFLDLDGFKALNDAHGHLAGDRILRLTARRLLRHVPQGAAVTRFGGDEFVVLLPGLGHADEALQVAQALRMAVLAPLQLGRRPVRLSCSIGVAIGPRDARTPEELLRCADRAMLEAKASGRNQVCELDATGHQRLDRRGRLRRELGHAIEEGRLSAAFQPLWDLRGRRMAGVEMLARWHDPELGVVSPAEFIPVAEESGLIGALGLWAVREAVRCAVALRAAGLWHQGSADDGSAGGMRVSVNVSTVQLANPRLVEDLVEAVTEAGGQTQWLELELTESVQLAEDPEYAQRMRSLREAGFHLAIDDFGAGYSSFSYLSRLYFDRLKIDRALVTAAMQASDRSAVTGSIIAMAHRLGLQVVAEGIETPQQLALLAQQGCDVLQGYHIARPMPLTALLRWQPADALACALPGGPGSEAPRAASGQWPTAA